MFDFLKQIIAPPLGRCLIKSIAASLSVEVVGYENYRYLKEMGRRCIIVFWHGQQFYPIYFFRNHKIVIMVSLSRDGEIQDKILSSFGYDVVRGSSSRGAVSGLIGLVKKVREGYDAAIALDGPRGPYRSAKEGVNYLAIKEDCCVLPIACAFSSYKQFNAWDKYELPYPMTRGVLLIGRPIMPSKLNYPAMTHKYLEKILNQMTDDAREMLLCKTAAVETKDIEIIEKPVETLEKDEADLPGEIAAEPAGTLAGPAAEAEVITDNVEDEASSTEKPADGVSTEDADEPKQEEIIEGQPDKDGKK